MAHIAIKIKERCRPCGADLCASHAPNEEGIPPHMLHCLRCGYFEPITAAEFEYYSRKGR